MRGKLGYFIIGSAVIWGAVMILCALKLKGTGAFKEISVILSAGAGIHLILIWGPIAGIINKNNKGKDK